MNTLELGVNIDHIATIRQARFTPYPNLLEAVTIIEQAGADAITLHLREDRRHIQDKDVYAIRKHLTKRMNLEMAATDEMLNIALDIQPHDVCIVPEKREELTTEGGLDIIGQFDRIQRITQALTQNNIRVSLFIEPDIEHIKRVPDIGAPVIELHTGTYANIVHNTQKQIDYDAQARELERLQTASRYAHEQGIQVNAGHGLDYSNTAAVAAIPELRELNIGHAIIAQAIFCGIAEATRDMKTLMLNARH